MSVSSQVNNDAPITRSERRKRQTRARLKQAAFDLIKEQGYAALTIKAITDRADLGYGTYYLHFKHKDDVVWELTLDLAATLNEEMEKQLEGVPFPRREYLSWVFLFGYVGQDKAGFAEMYGTHGSVILNRRYQQFLADLHIDNLNHKRYSFGDDLNAPPVEFMAQFSAGALFRLLVWWAEKPNDYTPEDMASMLFNMVYRRPPPE